MNIGILCSTLAIGQTPAVPPLPVIPAAPAPIVRTLPAVPATAVPAPAMKVQTPAPMPAPTTPAPSAPVLDEKAAAATEEAKEEAEGDKFFLEKLLGNTAAGQRLADDGWKIYGWTQGSYNYSTVRNNNNLPVPFIQRANAFSLNQNWLHIEKTIDTEKKEVQLGFGFDGLYGSDYALTLSRNLFSSQLNNLSWSNPNGWDIFQMYADLYLPNLGGSGTTLRMGKFATFLEYEVVQGISNPFISRSYLFQYNPFTHTGALAITPLGDDWTIQNGAVLGADNWFDNTTNSFTYIGALKWAPKDGKTWAQFGTMIGSAQFNQAQNFNNYDVFNFQLSHKLTDNLTYLLDASYSFMQNVPLASGNTGTANWYGMVNYLFYTHNDQLTSNFRFELFNDVQGIRTGYEGLYTGLTYGLTYKPTPWLYIMPEVRYDYNNGNGTSIADRTVTGPFDGKKDLFTTAVGFIVRW
jgi:hypothetical protein